MAPLNLLVKFTIFPNEGSNLKIAAPNKNKKGDIFNEPFSNSKFKLKNNNKKKIAKISNKISRIQNDYTRFICSKINF